jgi:hypothetical protein
LLKRVAAPIRGRVKVEMTKKKKWNAMLMRNCRYLLNYERFVKLSKL